MKKSIFILTIIFTGLLMSCEKQEFSQYEAQYMEVECTVLPFNRVELEKEEILLAMDQDGRVMNLVGCSPEVIAEDIVIVKKRANVAYNQDAMVTAIFLRYK